MPQAAIIRLTFVKANRVTLMEHGCKVMVMEQGCNCSYLGVPVDPVVDFVYGFPHDAKVATCAT